MAWRILRAARLFGVLLLGVALMASPPAGAGRADPAHTMPEQVAGLWTTEDGNGVIAIEPCGDALCGRIVGIVRQPGEPIPTDVHGASQCGLTIITEERPESDGTWLGHVTDPRTGTIYGAQIWLGHDGNLRLRGFLGIPLLGQTQTWHHFTGRLASGCALV
jgi:uncharacterized protein (DUF2147 family)